MNQQDEWQKIGFDLAHAMGFENGILSITFSPVKNHFGSTAVSILNKGSKKLVTKFDWYKITDRRKKKSYELEVSQKKRFVVPPTRRITIMFREGDSDEKVI